MILPSIMVDIETLDTRPTAAMVAIGACKFSWETGVVDKFYINIDPLTCKDLGMTISKDTVEWWSKQSKEARAAWMTDPRPVQEAMSRFADWIGSDKHEFWCHGASFDYPILQETFQRCGMTAPWKYWNQNDTRTIFNTFGINNKTLHAADKETVYHNALDDCLFQTKNLIQLIGEIKQ